MRGRSRLFPQEDGHGRIAPPVGPVAAENGEGPVVQGFEVGQDRVPLAVAVGAAVVEGDGHGAAGTQQPQPRVDGRQGGVRLGKDGGITAGEVLATIFDAAGTPE